MKTALALLLAALPLSACATASEPAVVPVDHVWPEGTAVPVGQPVAVDDLVVTPLALEEDSRCPPNARCVWAGRVVVTTRIDGDGWRETHDLVLGEGIVLHERELMLAAVTPDAAMAGAPAPAIFDYRFTYE